MNINLDDWSVFEARLLLIMSKGAKIRILPCGCSFINAQVYNDYSAVTHEDLSAQEFNNKQNELKNAILRLEKRGLICKDIYDPTIYVLNI